MYFEVEPLLIQNMMFDFKGKEMYIEKDKLNKEHGAILRKQQDLNMSSVQQQMQNSLIKDKFRERR